MIVSSRGEAAQISSTLMSPRVVSIWASMPMCPAGRPALISTWVSRRSSATTSAADCTFGSITSSRRMPAWPTTSITSNTVHSVSHALMRTQSTLSPQSCVLIASTTFARAASFSSGDTESSRSRKTMSAGRPGALPSIFSLDPGTERHERRGSSRVRADMDRSLRAGRMLPRREHRSIPRRSRSRRAVRPRDRRLEPRLLRRADRRRAGAGATHVRPGERAVRPRLLPAPEDRPAVVRFGSGSRRA